MSSTSKPKKPNKTVRPSTKKMNNQNQSVACDGVYGDARLVYSLISSMGSRCTVQVRNGDQFSGIFHTVSPQMDIVLAAAHKLETSSLTSPLILDSSIPFAKDIISELIFHYSDIVHLEIHDTNLSFAEVPVKSNGDAGVDAKFSSANGAERTLEPWDGGGDSATDISLGGLEDGPGGSAFNSINGGWGPEDMFRTNREQYGVKSSYNPDMLEYTTRLENENTADFEKRKARADKLAQEIESSSNYMKNINLEVDDSVTEEEKFSAVIRDNNMHKYQRGRGRSRDHIHNQRPGYYRQGPGNMGRSGGAYGPGRSNTPTNPGESPTSPPGQGKNFLKQTNQASRPPRFNRMGPPPREGGNSYQKDDDRGGRLHENRIYDNASINSGYGNQKPPRSGNQSRGGYSKPSNPPDYVPHGEGPISPLSGQSTPQTVSRDSSSSSLNQQPMYPQWKEEDRMHSSAPPPTTNPQLSRAYPSQGIRGEKYRPQLQLHKVQVIPRILGRPTRVCKPSEDNSFPSSASSGVPVMTEQNLQGAPGSYLDKGVKQPSNPGFRSAISTTGSAQQPPRLFYTPKGLSPPVGGNPQNAVVLSQMIPSTAGQMFRPPHMLPQQPRFPMAATTIATPISTTSAAPPSNRRPNFHTEVAGKASSTTKFPPASAPTGQPVALSKSNSTGSSKERTTKRLKDFKNNFNLQLSDPPSSDPSQIKSTVASATRSKSVDETTSPRPPPAANQPRTAAPTSNSGNTAAEPQVTATPTQPPPSVPTPLSSTNPGDVKTVSAGTGPLVAPPVEQPPQKTPEVSSQKTASDVTPTNEAPTSIATSTAEAAGAAVSSESSNLNPDAKAFTPKSLSKSSGTVTPQSPTPAAPQQVQTGAYYNQPGQILTGPSPMYFVSQKPSIPKHGQAILSPTPTDQSVMINPHLHPSSVGPIMTPAPYSATAPFVFTQNPAGQQIPTAQHAIMHQQTFPGVEPMLYTPPHMVPTSHRGLPAYPAEYQQSQAIQIQPQQQPHPSPQHQPQPAVTPQQAPSTQQATNYMNQQAPQQRPHSAHTPTPGLIRPASPATNVQPQAVSGSHSVALHHHTSNAVIGQASYFQQPMLTHGNFVSNNPHTYQLPSRQYMIMPQNTPHLPGSNPGGQPGYASAVVANQAQYPGRRSYHSQPAVQGYQQQAPN